MRSAVLLIVFAAPALAQQSVLPQPEPHATVPGAIPTLVGLSGRVVLDNGVPAPEPVLVEFIGAANSFATWSERSGQFRIPLDKLRLPQVVHRAVPIFTGATLVFRLPGVAEQTVALDKIQTLDDLKIPEVRLAPITSQSMAMLSNGGYGAPNAAHRQYARGMEEFISGKNAEAVASFDRAVSIYPQYAAAYEWRGRALEKLDRRADAIDSYRRAAEADPKFVQPLIELATLASQVQDSTEAARWADRVNRLVPDGYPQMYLVSATASYNLEHFEAAEAAARLGLAADPNRAYPSLHRILGEALHARRNYAAARTELAAYLAAIPNAADATEIRALIAECDAHLKL